jgi:hypothetical protein
MSHEATVAAGAGPEAHASAEATRSAYRAPPGGAEPRAHVPAARDAGRGRPWPRRAAVAAALVALAAGATVASATLIAPHLSSFRPAPATTSPATGSKAPSTTPQAASRSPSAVATAAAPDTQAPVFSCTVLETGQGGGESFEVTTVNGRTYTGLVQVSFRDESGHGFPSTEIDGAGLDSPWLPVPAADIGASAEPSICTASAG